MNCPVDRTGQLLINSNLPDITLGTRLLFVIHINIIIVISIIILSLLCYNYHYYYHYLYNYI